MAAMPAMVRGMAWEEFQCFSLVTTLYDTDASPKLIGNVLLISATMLTSSILLLHRPPP